MDTGRKLPYYGYGADGDTARRKKHIMKMKCRWLTLLLFGGLAACVPVTPTPGPGPTKTDILDPRMGQVLPLSPYTVAFESTALMGIDYFEVSVDGTSAATVAPISIGSCGAGCGTAFNGEYVWTPPSTGHFTISVAAFGNGQWGEPGTVEVEVAEYAAAQDTPPLLNPPPTPTGGFSGKVMVAARQNCNCREGGGQGYRILAVLMQGEQAEAVAVSEDGQYVKVAPPNAGLQCWIAGGLLELVEGNLGSLPFEGFPSLPPGEPGQPPVGAP
jgi:hypothetical protein